MAKRTILADDITGKEDESVRTFAFMLGAGQFYEIDLSSESLARFQAAVKPFPDHMRPIKAYHFFNSADSPLNEIRQWARANGYYVRERGVLAQAVLDAFNEAHKEED